MATEAYCTYPEIQSGGQRSASIFLQTAEKRHYPNGRQRTALATWKESRPSPWVSLFILEHPHLQSKSPVATLTARTNVWGGTGDEKANDSGAKCLTHVAVQRIWGKAKILTNWTKLKEMQVSPTPPRLGRPAGGREGYVLCCWKGNLKVAPAILWRELSVVKGLGEKVVDEGTESHSIAPAWREVLDVNVLTEQVGGVRNKESKVGVRPNVSFSQNSPQNLLNLTVIFIHFYM